MPYRGGALSELAAPGSQPGWVTLISADTRWPNPPAQERGRLMKGVPVDTLHDGWPEDR